MSSRYECYHLRSTLIFTTRLLPHLAPINFTAFELLAQVAADACGTAHAAVIWWQVCLGGARGLDVPSFFYNRAD